MFAKTSMIVRRETRGLTLIELAVVLAILAILIALAKPRYLSNEKQAYKAEADELLNEVKTLEWAYYQRYNAFDPTGSSIGFTTPGDMHWTSPSFGGNETSLQAVVSGAVSPLSSADSVWIVLQSDGSSSSGASF